MRQPLLPPLLALFLSPWGGCGAPLPSRAPEPILQAPGINPASCVLEELSRKHLQVEGSLFAYVEPELLLASRGDVLLGGSPNYLAVPSGDGGDFRSRANEMVGVLLEKDGGVRIVPFPPQLRGRAILATRGSPMGQRRWGLILSVLPPGARFPDRQEPEAIWFGVYGPRGWGRMESLPLDEGWHAKPRLSSRLVRWGDTLAWALPVMREDGTRGLKLLRGNGTPMETEDLPVRRVSGVDLFPHPERGLLVGVTLLREGEPSEVVEVLSRSDSGWVSTRIAEADGTHLSSPTFSNGGDALAWVSEPHPFAFHGSQLRAGKTYPGVGDSPRALDGPTGGVFPLHLETPFSTWISAQPFDSIRGTHWKLLGLHGEDQFLLDSLPNPLGNILQGVATEDGPILLAGPDMWKVTRGEGLATLLLTYRVACPHPTTQVPH